MPTVTTNIPAAPTKKAMVSSWLERRESAREGATLRMGYFSSFLLETTSVSASSTSGRVGGCGGGAIGGIAGWVAALVFGVSAALAASAFFARRSAIMPSNSFLSSLNFGSGLYIK